LEYSTYITNAGEPKNSSAKNSYFFQPKLNINSPSDDYEKEADATADKVMRMQQPFIQAKPLSITSVQRKCAHCEEEEKQMQRKEMNGNAATADHNLESYIDNLNGGGQSLPDEVRSFYEPRFGYDFSNVRVHTDSVAAKSAQSINALAYTSGNNIVFNSGQYFPATDAGKRLLGHELTHVIQQASFNTLTKIQAQHRCNPPEPTPCPQRRFNQVVTAFQTASGWLATAHDTMEAYLANPSARSNRRVANALRRHFGWTENIRQQATFPDIPRMVLNTINNALRNITVPIGADCPSTTPASDREGGILHARTPTTWNGSNCYTFFPPFFTRATAPRRATTVLHEMMHRWEGMTDILYEWEDGYPPPARSAQSNAESYAAMIRDLR